MLSLRLPDNIEKKLNEIAKHEKISKTAIIKDALNMYIDDYYKKHTPYDLGKDLFGKYGSDKGDLSAEYKKLLKDRIREKHSH
jgi:hypothetical protein